MVEYLAVRTTTLALSLIWVSVELRNVFTSAHDSIGLAIDAISTLFFSYALISKPKC